MKAAFKIYGLVVLFFAISGLMYGFILPYMLSART